MKGTLNVSDALEKAAAVGSYYIASGSFVLAFVTFIISVSALYVAAKIFREQKITELERRADEIKQRRNAEAFEIFKILTGIKDWRDDGKNKVVMTAYLSSAIVALREYPEFRDALLVQKNFFDRQPDTIHTIWIRNQINATMNYWGSRNPERLKEHSFIDYDAIKPLLLNSSDNGSATDLR